MCSVQMAFLNGSTCGFRMGKKGMEGKWLIIIGERKGWGGMGGERVVTFKKGIKLKKNEIIKVKIIKI